MQGCFRFWFPAAFCRVSCRVTLSANDLWARRHSRAYTRTYGHAYRDFQGQQSAPLVNNNWISVNRLCGLEDPGFIGFDLTPKVIKVLCWRSVLQFGDFKFCRMFCKYWNYEWNVYLNFSLSVLLSSWINLSYFCTHEFSQAWSSSRKCLNNLVPRSQKTYFISMMMI
jgi:hypothetical protein